MILAIDIGNTNIKFGVFDKDKLTASYRVSSRQTATADEYGVALSSLLASDGIEKKEIKGIIISSVIPSLNYTIEHMCDYFFKVKPIMVGPGTKTGINVKVDNTKEVGADRMVNSVAAYKKYGGPIIVIDFGTATTFNAITGAGEFIGGAISPGIKSSLDSLVNNTAKLPRIELESPRHAIAKNTVTNMQAGIVYGFAGLTEFIVKKMKSELKEENIKVVATGGLGELISKEVGCIDVVDRTLTLEGLYYLYNLNVSEGRI